MSLVSLCSANGLEREIKEPEASLLLKISDLFHSLSVSPWSEAFLGYRDTEGLGLPDART